MEGQNQTIETDKPSLVESLQELIASFRTRVVLSRQIHRDTEEFLGELEGVIGERAADRDREQEESEKTIERLKRDLEKAEEKIGEYQERESQVRDITEMIGEILAEPDVALRAKVERLLEALKRTDELLPAGTSITLDYLRQYVAS